MARNITIRAEEQHIDLHFILHDRDTKFSDSFDAVFTASGASIIRSPFQAPIANCYAESWIGSPGVQGCDGSVWAKAAMG
jgi:hypothetical protein